MGKSRAGVYVLSAPNFGDEHRAACAARDVDPEWFWFEEPLTGRREDRIRVHDRAIEVCNRCEVRKACDNWAFDNDIQFGVWGGRPPVERRSLRRAMRRAARARSAA